MAFKIIRNNIINVSADAIVNTANPKPAYASGVDSAIYKAAGARKLLKERKKIGDIEPGCAVSTPAFKLSAKYIIHTVGPEWQGGDAGERETVKNCYVNSLNLAKELGCESIAFPLIATGVYGFPKEDALRIAINVFSDFLIDSDMEITLVVFDEKSFVLSDKIFAGVETYIDDNYVTQKVYEEYETEDETRALLGDIPYRPGSRRFGRASRAKESSQGSFPMYASRSASMSESMPDNTSSMSESMPDNTSSMSESMLDNTSSMLESISDNTSSMSESMPDNTSSMSESISDSTSQKRILASSMSADMASSMPADMASGMPPDTASGISHKDKISSVPPQSDKAVHMSQSNKAVHMSLDDKVAHIKDTWQESLFHLIDERGYTDIEVYKRANVDRKLFSKIRSNAAYQPKKVTALAFALALRLNLDETKDFLSRAGYALSPSSMFDLIVEYFIEQEVYDIYTINLALFKHEQQLLGE